MLVVVSGSFTLAFGADFTFQISGLGLSKCHSSLGAVYTLVRVSISDSTRPIEELQSDNRTVTKIELATQQETKEQFNDQQKPESSGQRHHSPGVDGKSLEELLERLATIAF